MTIIIVKNPGPAEVDIPDLGISISALSQVDFAGPDGLFSKIDVSESQDLKPLVQSGTLIINDGNSDLTPIEGLQHIQIETEFEDLQQDDLLEGNIDPDDYLMTVDGHTVVSVAGNLVIKQYPSIIE